MASPRDGGGSWPGGQTPFPRHWQGTPDRQPPCEGRKTQGSGFAGHRDLGKVAPRCLDVRRRSHRQGLSRKTRAGQRPRHGSSGASTPLRWRHPCTGHAKRPRRGWPGRVLPDPKPQRQTPQKQTPQDKCPFTVRTQPGSVRASHLDEQSGWDEWCVKNKGSRRARATRTGAKTAKPGREPRRAKRAVAF